MKLFEEILRTRIGFANHAEPKFNYINLSARKPYNLIRELLEEWYSSYPESAKKNLRGRFISSNDIEHLAAFFELYLYNLLRKIGFEVEIHPEIQGKSTHPDFKAYYNGQPAFYLEAALAAPSKEETAARKRENVVYESIDKVNSPDFFLSVQVKRYSKENPSGGEWRKSLEKRLSSLDYNETYKLYKDGRHRDLPTLILRGKGWEVRVKAFPKGPEIRGKTGIRPIGVISSKALFCGGSEYIRKSIIKKAENYGDLDLPFIIAINYVNEFSFIANNEILNALFGDFDITQMPNGKINRRFERALNGAFIGSKGPCYCWVSAVMIFPNLICENIANLTPVIWHNPWAIKPLNEELMPLPQMVYNKKRNSYYMKPGNSVNEILGLAKDCLFI